MQMFSRSIFVQVSRGQWIQAAFPCATRPPCGYMLSAMPRPQLVLLLALILAANSRSHAFAAPPAPSRPGGDPAREALARGDEREALRIWSAAAAKGDREAQFGLGLMYDA